MKALGFAFALVAVVWFVVTICFAWAWARFKRQEGTVIR
jgi:hypothetical protein